VGYLSATAIFILMILVVSDVTGRYLSTFFDFFSPITGASEIASILMIVIVFPALAWAAISDKHVKVEIIAARLPQKAQRMLDIVMLFLAIGVMAVITWRSSLEALATADVSSMIKLPHAPFYWIMTVGLALFCAAIIILLVSKISQAGRK
jgi:TRAP-type C4-dicarboxylate transport system permease small subunit